jgi:hypothetical protein
MPSIGKISNYRFSFGNVVSDFEFNTSICPRNLLERFMGKLRITIMMTPLGMERQTISVSHYKPLIKKQALLESTRFFNLSKQTTMDHLDVRLLYSYIML